MASMMSVNALRSTNTNGISSTMMGSTNPPSMFPISQTLNVANPGPQSFPTATGRPTLSGGFAGGRVSGIYNAYLLCWASVDTLMKGTPAQILRTDDPSPLGSTDTSNRRKNTPSDQSMRRTIQDLVFSIDPNVKIEPEVEDVSLTDVDAVYLS